MIKVISDVLELRGIANKVSTSGKAFYMVNVEDNEGTAHSFYCGSVEALPPGLKKGDKVRLSFALGSWKGQDRYSVVNVQKVG